MKTPLFSITDNSIACKALMFFQILICSKAHDGKDNHHKIIGMLDLGPEGIVDRGSWMP